MREIAEQFHEQFWIVVHHRWLALICWIVICAIGWVIVEHLPNQYQSETKVYLDTTTDSLILGGSTELGKFTIDGDTDEIQILAQGNSTQTNNILVIENSAGTDIFTVGTY